MNKALLNQILKRKNDKKTWIIVGSFFACILLVFICVIASKHNAPKTKNTSAATAATVEPFVKIAQFNQSATGEAIGNLQASQDQTLSKMKKLESQNEKMSQQLQKVTTQMSGKSPQGSDQSKNASSAVKNSNEKNNSTEQSSNAEASTQNTNTSLTPAQSPQVVNLSNASVNQNNLNALGNPVSGRVSTQMPGAGISDFSFQYAGNGSTQVLTQKCTPKNCVLPGTFARAVLLGAADANASVNGQSNTTPILFRILGRGVLPNGFHSHLKGCFVVGEVFGDISSERGEVKLAQISCVINGKTISKSINGTAYFMGKEGIRGRAIMRNGPLLWNAGVAGMLSGLAQGVQQAQQTQSISPLGTTTTIPGSRIGMSMGAGGVQSAANTLANYYIKRADQYHPVIELNAGTIVNLVFLNQFLLTPKDQSTGAATTQTPSSAYWQSNNAQGSQPNANANNLAYGQSVNSDQAGSVQNQINQIGQNN